MLTKILRLMIMMYSGMHNIMEADIEQISQLMQFANALLEYHKQCSEILQVSPSISKFTQIIKEFSYCQAQPQFQLSQVPAVLG